MSIKRPRSRGFTLIELMIVMMIIGVLAGLLLPNLMRARFKAFHAGCISNEKNIATALESYAADNNGLYPPTLNTLSAGPLNQRFIAALPTCPSNGLAYDPSYTVDNATGNPGYTLACPGIHSFQLDYIRPNYPQVHNGLLDER